MVTEMPGWQSRAGEDSTRAARVCYPIMSGNGLTWNRFFEKPRLASEDSRNHRKLTSRMQVHLRNLKDLFEAQRVYRVPVFQRRYVWSRDEQWEPLWEDIQSADQICLDRPDSGVRPVDQSDDADHFLGAVVTQHESSPSDVELRSLIDGQQRLVTLQLMLTAVEEVFDSYAHTAAKRVGRLVRNSEEYVGDDQELVLKIQTTAADTADFAAAMSRHFGEDVKADSHAIRRARRYFADEIGKWIDDGTTGPGERIRALERALQYHVKMVVIELADSDDENLIFETLNARGTPLTDWDLTKNFIINSAELVGIDINELQRETLSEFDDEYWFEETRAVGAPRARVDLLLNYWMIMRTREPVEVKPRVTFRAVEEYVKAGGESISQVALDLNWIGTLYRELDERSDDSRFGAFLKRWRTMQFRVLTPLLLRVLAEEPSEAELTGCLTHLESYLVRRLICKMPTRGYYDLALAALRRVDEDSRAPMSEVLGSFLMEQEAERTRWPSDDEIRAALLDNQLYGGMPKNRLRLILEGIEMSMRSRMSDAGPLVGALSVERFMPAGWRANWGGPEMEYDDERDAAAERDRLIQTAGNLTLVTKQLNSSMSNAGLKDKRDALQAHSTLFLNKDLSQHSTEGWDEQAIRERGLRMAAAVVDYWPKPAS